MWTSTKRLGLSAAAILVAAGCASRTTREVVYTPTPAPAPTTVTVVPAQPVAQQPVIVATVAPPAPRTEVQPAAPSPTHVWVAGHWSYVNGQYDWVPGHWEAARAGYAWVPYRWEMVNGQWQLSGGTWRPM